VPFVNFHSRAAGDFAMFEAQAVALLKKMGHSGTVPSAILPEDIPQALARLQTTLAGEPAAVAVDNDEEAAVPLSRRAYPLVKMLEASLEAQCEVMWD
jgi:hypothetical protein